jgi:Tol biopolymer transport system component
MTSNRPHRRRLLCAGILVALGGIGSIPVALAATRPGDDGTRTTPAGETFSADAAPIVGARPSMSDDGRTIVYSGAPTDGSARASTVYLLDTSSPGSAPVELTRTADGAKLGDSVQPVISRDGCVVAVVTQIAYDLFRDDDKGQRWDVYKVVLPGCGGALNDWELVSTDDATGENTALDRVSPDDPPAISASGATIAYTHQADDSKDPRTAITVVDLTQTIGSPGRAQRVAGTPADEPRTTFRYRGQHQPVLSADGLVLAYTSDAGSDAVPPVWADGTTPGDFATSQVYVWNRPTAGDAGAGTVQLASGVTSTTVDAAGAPNGVVVTPADAGAGNPALSADGRVLAFTSAATNLDDTTSLPTCVGPCPLQVYRRDATNAAVTTVSRTADPAGGRPIAADRGATEPDVSGDGSQIAFVTRSTNLFPTLSTPGAEPDDGDVVVATLALGTLTRASVQADGSPADATNAHPVLSTLGDRIAFDTLSAGQLRGAAATGRQVVVLDRPATISIPDLDVGTIAVGFAGAEWFVNVKNLGPSTFIPSTVVSSDPQFAITGGTCGNGAAVLPGSSCRVDVVLTPMRPGPINATLQVTGAGPRAPSDSSRLSGAGGEPLLAALPAFGDFPPTVVGSTSTSLSFDVTNIGFSVATIGSVSVAGADKADYRIVSSSCLGQTMIPGASCTVEAVFAPKAAGHRTAILRVTAATGEYTGIIVGGTSTFAPKFQVATDSVVAGQPIGVGGSDFQPGSTVTIAWADGWGDAVVVPTDAKGRFLTTFPTHPNDRAGVRQLVVQGAGAALTASVRVVRRAADDGPGSPTWAG